jgi:glycosyltransferase involved in cell wall biosynthesis
MKTEPFISVVTPVYNGAAFLAECIESVLNQTYSNLEYVIVNNCSTDRTLAIAQTYANEDPRVRVVTNKEFVSAAQNHNNAVRETSPRATYCKVVSADDYLFPTALSTLVEFAVEHPSVGIINSYQQSGNSILWKGLSERVTVMSGREACRIELLDRTPIFGTPTSLLYRADLVRLTNNFFPNNETHTDTSACYNVLANSGCDFGFVHQVLSVERKHEGQISKGKQFGAEEFARLDYLMNYGHHCLNAKELITCLNGGLQEYYTMLAMGMLKFKGIGFRKFHLSKLHKFGFQINSLRVVSEALPLIAKKLRHPKRMLYTTKLKLA